MLGLGLAKRGGLGNLVRELIVWREEKQIKKAWLMDNSFELAEAYH